MDFADFDIRRAEEGVAMEIKHPVSGKVMVDPAANEPCAVLLMGADSSAYREAENAIIAAAAAERDKEAASSLNRLRGEVLERLVACTVGFRHVEIDGKAIDKTPAAFRAAYARLPWLREQALAFIEDRRNFLPKPPTVSPAS
jgi:hypothetical protein